MTFSYMVYMLSRCEEYFSIILSAVRRELSRLTEMHNLSLNDADSHVLMYVFLSPQELHLEWPWGSSVTLKLFVVF